MELACRVEEMRGASLVVVSRLARASGSCAELRQVSAVLEIRSGISKSYKTFGNPDDLSYIPGRAFSERFAFGRHPRSDTADWVARLAADALRFDIGAF